MCSTLIYHHTDHSGLLPFPYVFFSACFIELYNSHTIKCTCLKYKIHWFYYTHKAVQPPLLSGFTRPLRHSMRKHRTP